MTTISSNTTALSSLLSLYANGNGASTTSDDTSGSSVAGLTSGQTTSVLSMVEGEATQNETGLNALLDAGSDDSDGSDMSAIFDAIDAQMVASANSAMNASSSGGSDTGSTTITATTEQQKAAAAMQSVYQTQQSNLFTLLG